MVPRRDQRNDHLSSHAEKVSAAHEPAARIPESEDEQRKQEHRQHLRDAKMECGAAGVAHFLGRVWIVAELGQLGQPQLEVLRAANSESQDFRFCSVMLFCSASNSRR